MAMEAPNGVLAAHFPRWPGLKGWASRNFVLRPEGRRAFSELPKTVRGNRRLTVGRRERVAEKGQVGDRAYKTRAVIVP
jgi:hypothetical protein